LTVIIGLVRLSNPDPPSPPLWSRAARFLSRERQESIGRLRNPDDRRRSAAAETLLRLLLMERFGLASRGPIRLVRSAAGKPYLEDIPNLEFNLSHAGRWVACAIDVQPVGIDVEQILPIDVEGIARRFFSQQEYADLMRWTEEERLSCFYRLWTLKESYLKAVGTGLQLPLDTFTVSAVDQHGNEGPFFRIERSGSEHYRLFSRRIDEDHWLSVCAMHSEFSEPLIIPETELYTSFLRLVDRRG